MEAHDKNHCWHVGQRRRLTQPGKYHTPAVKWLEVWEDQDQVGRFPPNGLLVNMSPGNESIGLNCKAVTLRLVKLRGKGLGLG